MPAQDGLGALVHDWQQSQFKAYEQRLLHGAALDERAAKLRDGKLERRRSFMAALGTDMAKLDRASAADDAAQEAALEGFLMEARRKMSARASAEARDAGSAADRLRQVHAEAGNHIVSEFASTVFTPERADYAGIGGVKLTDGAINSGWVFPENPGLIRLRVWHHYPKAYCTGITIPSEAQFEVDFAFVPATTASYEMTAILAFHGFYLLRSDDSWYDCRQASVKLSVAMNVDQYHSLGAQETTLIDVSEQNVDEVVSYDRTRFFSYTATLRGGDPVIVSVKGTLQAAAHGGGAYSELNFLDGTANYIQPLFVSVIKL